MTVYKGRWDAIRGPLIMTTIMLALIAYIYFIIPHSFWTYFFIILIAFFLPLAYSGLVLKIKIDEKKLVVVRPFSRVTVKFQDVALCAVHSVDEGKSLIYAFVKKWGFKGYTVKGIKPKLPFEEIVKISAKNEELNLDINFNSAKKLPVSFVENGEELKDRFLLEVGKYHVRIMGEK